jgi:hypothetical protein
MSQPRWLTRAVRSQKRACLLALALVVGALWIAIPMGQWKVGVFVSAGIALGLANLALTELSLLRSVESGDLISRKQYALSSLVRLTGVSLVAGALAVVFWPEGGTVLLGLALFQMITLVLTGLPLLKEIKKA